MLPILLSLVVTQSPPPLVSADVDAPPPTPVAEVTAPPRDDKHAADSWQVAALATAIVPTSLDGAPFVFGLRGELYGDPVAEVDTQGLGNPPAARVEDES